MGSWNENGIKNGNGNGKGNRKHIMESHSKKMTVKSHHHHLVGKAKHIACRVGYEFEGKFFFSISEQC